MNRTWSELNKKMQVQLKKRDSFAGGIETLLCLRSELIGVIRDFRTTLTEEEFSAIPFVNAAGFHNKTIAYSLYHIFRIEDIVANILIREGDQIFLREDYQRKMNSSILTTGNELIKAEIAEFSRALDLEQLYAYLEAVNASSTELLKSLEFADLKRKISPEAAEKLCDQHSVSTDERAVWLVDYWLGKDIKGLIQMPFSRHWIIHVEAALRIQNKLRRQERAAKS